MSKNELKIRPQQPLYWLLLLGVLLLGVVTASRVYGRGVWLFAVLFIVVGIGFLSDRIAFDGRRLRRCGLWAWLGSCCGLRREITLDEIETVTSYPVKSWGSEAKYRTLICGAGIKWTVGSYKPHGRAFIKSLLGSVSPHQLDPLSADLRAYWGESNKPSPSFCAAAETGQKVRRWRRLANSLSLDGTLDASSRYFRLAYEHDPNNAHLLYEMARFIRRGVVVQSTRLKDGALHRAIERAESYLRLAAQIAEKEKDAALIERIGETFFELQQRQTARHYFELAVQLDPQRPRANIGLAGLALQRGQVAKAIHHYYAAARGAREAGVTSLASLAERKAEYYRRLLGDDEFLNAEATRQNVLTQLKWGRRAALTLFCVAWLLHLTSFQFTNAAHNLTREISATALVMWVVTSTATFLFSQRRS